MLIFVDEYGKHHSALAEFKETKGVNGEKSLSGTIYTNEEILEGIGRGWRILWNNEQYCLSYVYPVDEGNRIAVEFDAVHEFFFDFKKTVIHSQLDGSNTMQAYLDFIFNGSGYVFNLEVNVNAFEKESFGFKNRLDLFKDIIQSTGVEYTVSGKVVRILKEVGTDLSTVVRKGFNMNELTIEKDAGSFITYKKGYGAFFDEDDHSQGRLEVEYLSPLSEIYGILEGDPIVDERYKNAENFETRLQNEVESSYNVSVNIDMEDLTKAGYQYEQPHAGDYIMAINDDLNFRKRIRIMSYETEYDTQGNIVKHDVSCGSESIASKMTSSDSNFRKDIQAGLENAINTAEQALVSADGKSILNFGPDEPLNPSVGDTWYKVVGEKTIMQVWNGYEWIDPLDFSGFEEAIKDIEEEIVVMTANINTAVDNANQAVIDAGLANANAVLSLGQSGDALGQLVEVRANINGLQTIVADKADETTVVQLASQWQTTTALANGHTSQISSLGTDINLRVLKSDVINQINVSTEGILIAGNKVRITGQTSIDSGVIKTAMIGDAQISGAKIANATISSAKIISLDANKLTAGTINTANVTIGTATSGKRVNITGAGLIAHDNNGKLRVKLGVQDLAGDGQSDPSTLVFYTGNGSKSASIGTNTDDTFVIGTDLYAVYTLIKTPTQLTLESDSIRFNNNWTTVPGDHWRMSLGDIDGTLYPNLYVPRGSSGILGHWEYRLRNIYTVEANIRTLSVGYGSGAPQEGDLTVGKDGGGARVASYAVYNRTHSGANNVGVGSNGVIYRSTSARKYKTDIQVTDMNKAKTVLQIKPVSWLDKAELADKGQSNRYYGFIADDFDQLGLREVVMYGEDGQVESLAYDRISMYHNVILSEHEQEIQNLKNANAQLLGEISMLRSEVESLRQLAA